jgi:type IV secretion system protein VirB10
MIIDEPTDESPRAGAQAEEPELKQNVKEKASAKNHTALIYVAISVVLIGAVLFSNKQKKPAAKEAAASQAAVQSATNGSTDPAALASQLHSAVSNEQVQQRNDEQQAAAALAVSQNGQGITPLYGPDGRLIPASSQRLPNIPGGVPLDSYQHSQEPQKESVLQQTEDSIAKKLREMRFETRFQSNLVYRAEAVKQGQSVNNQDSRDASPDTQKVGTRPTSMTPQDIAAAYASVGRSGMPQGGQQLSEQERKTRPEIDVNASVGKPYVIFEGNVLETVLVNQLDGDSVGPVKAMVSQPFYSHDRQHVLIPEGTIVLGEARKIGEAGFGQQRRMALVFHRMIMPDGYSVDLDQFQGLNQIGEAGLKDKVNNHYLQIFGTSIALGIIAGAAQIEEGGSTLTSSGSQTFVNGAAQSVSASSSSILGRFMQIPPTITIRPGHRIKVYIMQDMRLPAYEKHAIRQTY